MVSRGGSINPRAFPDEEFELYSIPAHDRGGPEIVLGSDIGSSKQIVRQGDVMISKIIPHIRRARVVNDMSGRRQIASGEWIVFRGKAFDPNYLRHLLISDGFHSQFMNTVAGVGGSLVRARPEQVKRISIPLPTLDEQRRIAAILDHADALRASRRQVLAHLDALEESIFVAMFAGHRELRPISELCELIVDCVNRTAPTVQQVTPFKMLRTTNIRNGAVDTQSVRYVTEDIFTKWNRRTTPRRGDVLLTREAPVGEPGVLRSDDRVFLGQRLMLYRANPEVMTPDYLVACFRSSILRSQFERLGSGSTVKHLPLPACRGFEIPIASVGEQRMYSDRVVGINEMRGAICAALAQVEFLFSSLQLRAFRGEL